MTAARPVRVDAHHHLWDLDVRPQPWTDGLAPLERSFRWSDLEPALDESGIDGTVVVQTAADAGETLEMLALAAARPRVLGVVGWLELDTATDRLADALAAVRAAPGGERLVGVRHQLQVEPDKDWLSRPRVQASLALLGEQHLAYDLVVSPEQLPDVERVVAATPGTRFVLDHAGKPPLARGDLADWRRDLAALARHDHVRVKLSGLVTEADWDGWTLADLAPAVATTLELFGPERTMWGSDWPVTLLAGAGYADWVGASHELLADLSTSEHAAVWGATAVAAYGLSTGVAR